MMISEAVHFTETKAIHSFSIFFQYYRSTPLRTSLGRSHECFDSLVTFQLESIYLSLALRN